MELMASRYHDGNPLLKWTLEDWPELLIWEHLLIEIAGICWVLWALSFMRGFSSAPILLVHVVSIADRLFAQVNIDIHVCVQLHACNGHVLKLCRVHIYKNTKAGRQIPKQLSSPSL